MGMFDYVEIDPELAAEIGLPVFEDKHFGWQSKSRFPVGGDSMARITVHRDRTCTVLDRLDDESATPVRVTGAGCMEIHTFDPEKTATAPDGRRSVYWYSYTLDFTSGVLFSVTEIQAGCAPSEPPTVIWQLAPKLLPLTVQLSAAEFERLLEVLDASGPDGAGLAERVRAALPPVGV